MRKPKFNRMDLQTAKDIALIAAPLSKTVLDTYLLPYFQEIRQKWLREKKIVDYAFEDKFLDYLTDLYEKIGVLNTIAFKKREILLNDVYIPLTLRCNEITNGNNTPKEFKIESFDEDIFSKNNKILIIDNAGMGKSTLSKKLLLSSIEKNSGVPVLIELRRLSKDKDIISEILEQINPINDKIDRQFILDLIKRGDFIFFLDGFDEISLAERAVVTSQIETFISKAKKNKFILTSRPEDALSSFGNFQKHQIKPLEHEEAYQLIKKYDPDTRIADILIDKVKEPETLKSVGEYLTTPLLVSLLFTAFEHKQQIPFKKHIFYRQVFDALYESHDLSKGGAFERDKYSKLASDEFHRVLRIFGYRCLMLDNKIEFTRDELEMNIQKAIDFCPEVNCTSSNFIKDLLVTVPLFTKDGIYFKWSHKSLQEYFAAQFIYLDGKEKQADILRHISFHQENSSFLNIIDLYSSIDPTGFEEVIVKKLLTDYLTYIDTSYKGFDKQQKLYRQKYSFGYYLFLINFPVTTKTSHELRLIFELVRPLLGMLKKGMSVSADYDKDKLRSNIKIPIIRKPEQVLIDFLFNLKVDYIVQDNYKQETEKIDLNLPLRKVFEVTEKKNSILNKEGNFEKTNRLISFFIGKRLKYIDISKAKKMLITLDKRDTEKLRHELLNF